MFMVFNATFKNMPVLARRSVLLVGEAGEPDEPNDPSQIIDKLYCIMSYRVQLAITRIRTHNF
jgi:hypothetical protein